MSPVASTRLSRTIPYLYTLCFFCTLPAYAVDIEPQITVSKPGTGSAKSSGYTAPQFNLSSPDERRFGQNQSDMPELYRHPLNTRKKYPRTGRRNQPTNNTTYNTQSSDNGLPPFDFPTPEAPPAFSNPQVLPHAEQKKRVSKPKKHTHAPAQTRTQPAIPTDSEPLKATDPSKEVQATPPAPQNLQPSPINQAEIPSVAASDTSIRSTKNVQSAQPSMKEPQKTSPEPTKKTTNASQNAHQSNSFPFFIWVMGFLGSFAAGALSFYAFLRYQKRNKLSQKTQNLLKGKYEWKD